MLHELGQPTHAFDLAKLGGRERSSCGARRLARRITTLDGVERTLRDDMIVIADAERPQAVAGVMGGRDSEVTDATTDIFLEVANFNPRRIRDARRALGLSTDASYRFERGVDVDHRAAGARARRATHRAARRRARRRAAGRSRVRRRAAPTRITLRPSRVARLLGETLATDEIESLSRAASASTPIAWATTFRVVVRRLGAAT